MTVVDERLAQLRRKSRAIDPGYWKDGSPSARVLDALEHNRELVAAKVFSAAGVDYRPGDDFIPTMSASRVGRLAELGFVCAKSEYSARKAHAAVEDFLNHLTTPIMTLNEARQRVPKEQAKVFAAREVLRVAETGLADATARLAQLEEETAQLLAGEDVDQLLEL